MSVARENGTRVRPTPPRVADSQDQVDFPTLRIGAAQPPLNRGFPVL